MEHVPARAHLEAERDRLQSVRAGLEAAHPDGETEEESFGELSHADQHPADVGTEAFEHEKDASILEQVEQELGDVERALRRLDDGSYGTCERCGDSIPDDRLEALPAARFCMEHQRESEGYFDLRA